MNKKALEYGKLACDTMMRKFKAEDLPPKGGFHYHAGVFLAGMMDVYSVCGDEKYFNYAKGWVDSIIPETAVITRYCKGTLDDHMAGILLFPLFEKTGEERYEWAIHQLVNEIRNWLRNEYGGYWHMESKPHQMWLDSLYMVSELQMLYATKYNDEYFKKQPVQQALLMYEHMQDPKTKLLRHVWDASREITLCDKETGLTPEVWGRAMGWYVVSVLDIMEYLDKDSDDYKKLAEIEKEVLGAVLGFRDKEKKLWYQVVDKGDRPDNWVEASCSCLFTYAAAKAVRMGLFDESVLELISESLDAIIDNFVEVKDGDLLLSGVCIGTGINDYAGYIARPTSTNDLHGMGAFLLMCGELALAK
ncbi:MAG: glycoside hydrolase family 88 protein [Clostridia bacterium]|nr:glycoside hydrolase family 88 protein [Clostridia bacterium]